MRALMQTTVCIDVSENVDGKQEKIFWALSFRRMLSIDV